MKVCDLIKFTKSGMLATVVEVRKDNGDKLINDYAMLWVSGDVNFKNPTCMTLHMINRTGKVVSHAS